MISESELLFQLGAIMLLAFIAATMARKLNQTVMIGYIIIGIFIGPKMSISLFGLTYHGLIADTTLADMLSQVGLVMLMFFVGLEFSFSKLKRTHRPAIILAIIDTSVGLFVGFIFASILRWPLIDSIFLAGVVSMSSTSIAMKVLFDLKRMSSPEVEFLIGLVVVETFIAMLILAVASGMIVDPNASAISYGRLLLGVGAFYAFFVWVAVWAVPRVVSFFEKIDNDELFILFALGIVFLTSGIASLMNVPPIIGAFFIGMVLAESKVTEKVEAKLESFKDAFVAIFFTSFGMMIDPSMFRSIYLMILLAVPLVLFYEVFMLSAITYFMGFSARASTTIGTSMCGRGVESILYASVGSRVKDATMGAQLNPFAGAFCFIMSAITPPLVKHSAKLASALTKVIPQSLKFSGAIVSRTLGKVILPSDMNSFKGARATAALLISLVFVCVGVLVGPPYVQDLLLIVGVAIVAGILLATRKELGDIVARVDYSDIGVGRADRKPILRLVSTIILGAVLASLLICYSWGSGWELAAAMAAGYAGVVIAAMVWVHRVLYVAGTDTPPKVYHMTVPVVMDEQETAVIDMPAPVYGMQAPVPPMAGPPDFAPEPGILHQGER